MNRLKAGKETLARAPRPIPDRFIRKSADPEAPPVILRPPIPVEMIPAVVVRKTVFNAGDRTYPAVGINKPHTVFNDRRKRDRIAEALIEHGLYREPPDGDFAYCCHAFFYESEPCILYAEWTTTLGRKHLELKKASLNEFPPSRLPAS